MLPSVEAIGKIIRWMKLGVDTPHPMDHSVFPDKQDIQFNVSIYLLLSSSSSPPLLLLPFPSFHIAHPAPRLPSPSSSPSSPPPPFFLLPLFLFFLILHCLFLLLLLFLNSHPLLILFFWVPPPCNLWVGVWQILRKLENSQEEEDDVVYVGHFKQRQEPSIVQLIEDYKQHRSNPLLVVAPSFLTPTPAFCCWPVSAAWLQRRLRCMDWLPSWSTPSHPPIPPLTVQSIVSQPRIFCVS